MKILFFGSDLFSAVSLTKLHSHYKNIQLVIPHQKDQKNVVPIKQIARQLGIKYHFAPKPPKPLKQYTMIDSINTTFDLAVVVSFGYFFPASLIKSFPMGAINVHPSLLPKYRGAAPIYHTLLKERLDSDIKEETGVTIMELHPKEMDAGDIYYQTKMEIEKHTFYKTLHDKLADQGASALLKTIQNFDYYKENATPQDSTKATYAPKITKEYGFIDFNKKSDEEIFRVYRAVGQKVPIFSFFKQKVVKFEEISLIPESEPPIVEDESKYLPGTIFFNKKQFYVKCNNGKWISIGKFRVTTKDFTSGMDFVNGFHLKGKSLSLDERDRFTSKLKTK